MKFLIEYTVNGVKKAKQVDAPDRDAATAHAYHIKHARNIKVKALGEKAGQLAPPALPIGTVRITNPTKWD